MKRYFEVGKSKVERATAFKGNASLKKKMFKRVGQTFEQQTALCKKNLYLYAPTVTHKFFKLSLFIQSTQ